MCCVASFAIIDRNNEQELIIFVLISKELVVISLTKLNLSQSSLDVPII